MLTGKVVRIVLWSLLAFAAVAWTSAGAVDLNNGTWHDEQGITVDAANRNADAIRRSQNRQQKDINTVNR